MTEPAYLPHSTPEAQGIPSAAIRAFLDAVERAALDVHSVIVLRHGNLVAEGWWDPYGPQVPHMLYSLSKSFTSSAIGLLVAEGRLTVDAPVLGFFPDEAPATPDANLRAMRIRHLLTMSSGHDTDTLWQVITDWAPTLGRAGRDLARDFLAQPVVYEPGTHFVYNSGATYMLSAIVQRITGMRLLEYLRPRLLDPLGIAHPTWEASPQGIDVGAWGLSITTADIARFGQLYLQQGVWQGVRLLPAAWVAEATSRQVASAMDSADIEWAQGYGYQFWRCRHGAYRGDGAFGQFCVVMPQQGAVIAITSGTSSMQGVLDRVWEQLLPAMGATPLPDDPAARRALMERLAGLRLPPQRGQGTAPTAAQVSGKGYAIAPNDDTIESIAFRFGGDACALTIRNAWGVQEIPCGYDRWLRGSAAMAGAAPWKVAASGAWADEQTYVARLWWYETPFARTFTCRFEGDRLLIERHANVSFGLTDRPPLEGRLA